MGIMGFLIVKLLYGGKHFESESLDKLAQDMEVKSVFRDDKLRYYKAKANPMGCSTLYDGSIIFDKKYYDLLTPEEVLAVGAHELNHIVRKHIRKRFYRQLLPSLLVFVVSVLIVSELGAVGVVGVGPLAGLAMILPFLFALFGSSYVNASWLREQETECDLRSVEFGYGESMITALTKIRIRFPRSKWDVRLSKLRPHNYPTIEQRIQIIKEAIDGVNKYTVAFPSVHAEK